MMKFYQIDFDFDRMVGLNVDFHSPWINIKHINNAFPSNFPFECESC